jgi:hypothetical protein
MNLTTPFYGEDKMFPRSKNLLLVVPLLALWPVAGFASTTAIDLGTDGNASNWLITGGGAADAPAMQRYDEISLTSDAHNDGTFVNGASLAAFNGFWYADETFTIPTGATNVVLNFSGLQGDDRVVLELNGNILGDFFLNGAFANPPTTGSGEMSFPPGPPDVAYTFTGTTSGTTSTGFNIGGDNDLRLIVNNTHGSDLSAGTKTFQGSGDATDATVVASINYDVVPEPASVAILCAAGVLCRRRRKFQRTMGV